VATVTNGGFLPFWHKSTPELRVGALCLAAALWAVHVDDPPPAVRRTPAQAERSTRRSEQRAGSGERTEPQPL